jgi:AcrR family transcriptional regulator
MSKAEKTRQYIVEKTAPVFNRKGFAGTSLSDMTAATGLTKGSIYGNFASKDEVALAVFDHNVSLLNTGIQSAIAAGTDALGKLLNMVQFYRSEFRKTAIGGGCPILNTAIEADDTHALLKERAVKAIRSWKKHIEGIVKTGISKGEIRTEVNAAAFAVEYISLIEGGILLAKTTGDRAMLDTCLRRIESIINNELKP